MCRPGRRGEVVRIGGGVRDQVRLAGCSTSADLFFDGRVWRIRFADGVVRRIGDGDGISLDEWHVTLLIDDDPPHSAAQSDVDAAWFESDTQAPCPITAGAPALIGTARWCSIRLPEAEFPTIGIVRRNRSHETRLHTIPGIAILVNGQTVRDSIRLADGAVLEVWSAAQRRPIRYRDPCEEIDRILGTIAQPATPDSPDPGRVETSIAGRLRELVGTNPRAMLRPDEAVLVAIVVSAVVGFAVLVAAQW